MMTDTKTQTCCSAALLAAPETIAVSVRRFACDGGHGTLGHPRVFLTIGKEGTVDCPYCDRHYVLEGDGREHH